MLAQEHAEHGRRRRILPRDVNKMHPRRAGGLQSPRLYLPPQRQPRLAHAAVIAVVQHRQHPARLQRHRVRRRPVLPHRHAHPVAARLLPDVSLQIVRALRYGEQRLVRQHAPLPHARPIEVVHIPVSLRRGQPLAPPYPARHRRQLHHLHRQALALRRPQPHLLHAPLQVPQPRFQRLQQHLGLAALREIVRDLLRPQPHGLEFLDLHDPRHVVVVVVPPPAVRRGKHRRQQPALLHPHQRAPRQPAGPGRLRDLKKLFCVLRHKKSLLTPCFVHR